MFKQFLDATRGSKFGSQLACLLLGEMQPIEKGKPRFVGKATICKPGPDGIAWICWDFVGKSGETQHAHAVDTMENFKANCLGLVMHLGLDCRIEAHKKIIVGFFQALDKSMENYPDEARNFQKEKRGEMKQVGLTLVTDPGQIERLEKQFKH